MGIISKKSTTKTAPLPGANFALTQALKPVLPEEKLKTIQALDIPKKETVIKKPTLPKIEYEPFKTYEHAEKDVSRNLVDNLKTFNPFKTASPMGFELKQKDLKQVEPIVQSAVTQAKEKREFQKEVKELPIEGQYKAWGFEVPKEQITGYDAQGVPLGESGKRLVFDSSTSFNVPKMGDPEYETYKQSSPYWTANKRSFLYGLTGGGALGVDPLDKLYEKQDLAIPSEITTKPGKMTSGELTGNLAKYGALYSTLGAAIEGSKVATGLGKLVTKLPKGTQNIVKTLMVEGIKDLAISTPLTTVEALASGKKGKDLAVYIAKQAAIDVAANAVMFGAGKLGKKRITETAEKLAETKAIKKVAEETAQNIEKQIGRISDEQLKVINDAITTAKDRSYKDLRETDVYRNIERVFGDKAPQIKKILTDQLDEKKAIATFNIRKTGKEFLDLGDEVGLKLGEGTSDSKLIQQYGEKRLLSKFDYNGEKYFKNELIEIMGKEKATKLIAEQNDLMLKQKYGDKYDGIKKVDDWLRNYYNKSIGEFNTSRKALYPEVAENLDVISKAEAEMGQAYKELVEVKALGEDEAYSELIKKLNTDITKSKLEIRKAKKNLSGKYIFKRDDYYHHFQEMGNMANALQNMIEGVGLFKGAGDVGEFAKARTKSAGFAKRRKFGEFKDDAVGGFVKYLQAMEYAKNIDESASVFRDFSKKISGNKKASNFAKYLTDFADDLTGKRTGLDAWISKTPESRAVFDGLSMLNSRAQANTILYKFSSMMNQVLNIPQGVAKIKNPVSLTKGLGDYMQYMFGDADNAFKKTMEKSPFLNERYIDDILRKFEKKMIDQPKRLGSWLLEALDNTSTRYLWASFYEDGIQKGVDGDDLIKYADEWTRKMVGGRGIGEIPLAQKSKAMKFIRPFTLEVNNVLKVQRDMFNDKDFAGLALLYASNHIFNQVLEPLTGQSPLPDYIEAVYDAVTTKDATLLERLGRVGGEVASAFPLGGAAASLYPEYGGDIFPDRAELFGKGDPTRFGTAPLLAKAVQKGIQDPKSLIYTLGLPFGGGQLERTMSATKALGRGQDFPGSFTKDGERLRTPIDVTPLKAAQALTMGEYSLPEVRKFFDDGNMPFGTQQTQEITALINSGLFKDSIELSQNLQKLRGVTGKETLVRALKDLGYTLRQRTEILKTYFNYKEGE